VQACGVLILDEEGWEKKGKPDFPVILIQGTVRLAGKSVADGKWLPGPITRR